MAKSKKAQGKERDRQEAVKRAVIEVSRRCLIDHYEHRDIEAVLSRMADDVVWLGPMDCQHCHGAENMRLILEPEYVTTMRIRDERWEARLFGEVCLVAGMLSVDTIEDERATVVTFHQSVTFVWAMTEQGYRVIHLQVSNAHDVPPRVSEPCGLGENAVEYCVQAFAADQVEIKAHKVAFHNMTGVVNYLSPDEVVCLVVDGPQLVRVVHEEGEFQVHGALADLTADLPQSFVRSHRSCVVNPSHVAETIRYRVTMDNGMRFPIAEKRYHEVRASIESAVAN